jgi:hypothetical protein
MAGGDEAMIAKLARALPPNRYIEIRHDVGGVEAGMAAILMEERPAGDQGDRVVAKTLSEDDRSFEVMACHMVGIDPPPNLGGYTYRVTRSGVVDDGFVGLCVEFPSLSWLAESESGALYGIAKLVNDVRSDMTKRKEEIPDPLSFIRLSARLSAEELEAIAYVRDMVQVNQLAGCQDAISKRHTQMVDLFNGAAAKLIEG